MKNKSFKVVILTFCIHGLLFGPMAIATEAITKGYDLRELALPSEVQGIPKGTGAVYYSPSVKDKVLIPVHFWGAVTRSGLHFIPADTSLVKGLSLAGGPKTGSRLDNIKLTGKGSVGEFKTYKFDLSGGGKKSAHEHVLKPGDTVFIEKSHFYEDRAYYTSLISVFATVLSTFVLYREIKKDD